MVKNHLKIILQKLYLQNRVQLTRYALEQGTWKVGRRLFLCAQSSYMWGLVNHKLSQAMSSLLLRLTYQDWTFARVFQSLHCTHSNINNDLFTIAHNNWLLLHMQRAIRFTKIRKNMFYFLNRDKVEQTHSFYTTTMYSKFLSRFGEEMLSQIGLSDQDIVLPSLWEKRRWLIPLSTLFIWFISLIQWPTFWN